MSLRMTRFSEPLDNDGKATSATVGLGWQDGVNNFAASVTVEATDITDGTAIDDKSKAELFKLAKAKFLTQVTNAVNETDV